MQIRYEFICRGMKQAVFTPSLSLSILHGALNPSTESNLTSSSKVVPSVQRSLYAVALYGIQSIFLKSHSVNTLRTGDADLRFYITTVQDG